MPKSLYHQVADAIRAQVKAGVLAPGERLPTITELAETHAVGTTTIKLALMLLKHDGVVVSQPGKAIYVAGPRDTNS